MLENGAKLFESFEFSALSYFLVIALIPGIVETAKSFAFFAVGNRPRLLSLGLGFFFVGFAEAISQGLIPVSWLPWVRVVVMGLAGSLAVSGYFDLIKRFTGNGKNGG